MLFFVDESFQTVGGKPVGSLGAVGIPAENYNHFCGWVFKAKRELLGAQELADCELKGNSCFARAVFTREDAGKPSSLLAAVDRVLDGLKHNKAVVFALWTEQPSLLSLRNTTSTALTGPYTSLLHQFAGVVQQTVTGQRGTVYLDQLGHREDKHSACTIQNFIARTDSRVYLQRNLIQVPHYTHSAVSPGLQVADLVAYLAAHQTNPTERPELGSWWAKFTELALYERGSGSRREKRVTVHPYPIPTPRTRPRQRPAGRNPKRR